MIFKTFAGPRVFGFLPKKSGWRKKIVNDNNDNVAYKFLEHTADLRIKVASASLPELFCDAAKVMAEVIKKSAFGKKPLVNRQIFLSAADKTGLLVEFLNEILTLSHVNKEVYSEIKILSLDEKNIQAELRGVPVDRFDEDIKAATYHEAEVKKNEEREWEAVIVFDI